MQWRKQYAAFSKTPAGQAVFIAGLLLLCYTGLIFKLLNLLFILWWFAPLIILPLLNAAGRKVTILYTTIPAKQPHVQGAELFVSAVMHASHREFAEHSQLAGSPNTMQAETEISCMALWTVHVRCKACRCLGTVSTAEKLATQFNDELYRLHKKLVTILGSYKH